MNALNRRGFLKTLGLGAAVGWGSGRLVLGDAIYDGSKPIEAPRVYHGATAYIDENGKIVQPQREIPVLRETDVLVVGGGCAGVLAALAAARSGARVTIVERYGCFGGLWTAGLVLVVLATHTKTETGLTKCVRGIGDEMLERLKKIQYGIVNQAPGKRDPTSDPEATKFVMDEMLREAGVDILLHSWATNAILDKNEVKGVVFESKSGCFAVRAKVTIDATGDGDVYGAAGAAHRRHIHKIGVVHRLGNADRVDVKALEAAGKKPRGLGSITPNPSVVWINMQGPPGDCLDVETLTRSEMDGRRAIWNKIKTIQETPGHEKVFILDTASQLGIRASRTLGGLHEVNFEETMAGKEIPDVVAVGGAYSFIGERPCAISYGALVPVELDNLLAAGRCVAADAKMLNYTRLIGPCLLTGEAAGTAAGLAIGQKTQPRNVDIKKLQSVLRKQGAYLG